MAYDLEVESLRFILRRMQTEGEGNRLLVNTERVYLAKTNLILLKACLEEIGNRGVFIAVDRPYHYMAHLLRIHKIPHDGLLFIDAVTNISGERRVEGSDVDFLDTPFTIHKILEEHRITRVSPDGLSEEVDLLDRDFIMMDDISAFLYYGAIETGQQYLQDFLAAVGTRADAFTAVVVDREIHPDLYEFLSRSTDTGVDMGTACFSSGEDAAPGTSAAGEGSPAPRVRG